MLISIFVDYITNVGYNDSGGSRQPLSHYSGRISIRNHSSGQNYLYEVCPRYQTF